MPDIVILGAGAIGRGYLPWLFDERRYEFVFVDANRELVGRLRENGRFSTYRSKGGALEEKVVRVKEALHVSEYRVPRGDDAPALVFMNVGPRNCVAAAACLEGVECPVVLCENDPATVDLVKGALGYDRVYFAIPDVITSNSASPENLARDPLAVHTEDGTLFVDERAAGAGLEGEIRFCSEEELRKQWTAKLYLHNTPHCIAAYLGALVGARYLHESMTVPEIRKIVTGTMNEMLTALKLRWEIPHPFLEWYAEKEIARFSDGHLYDPISRVAREPLRKLELEGRLIGAAQICLSHGFIPKNILVGIVSAILFEDAGDRDYHLTFMRKVLPPRILITYVLGLRQGEVLHRVMEEQFPRIVEQLERIREACGKEGARA